MTNALSLSERNMQWYLDHWTAGPDEQEAPWFGWLSNRIPVYDDTLNLKTNVHVRGADLRPLIRVQRGAHQLARDVVHRPGAVDRGAVLGEARRVVRVTSLRDDDLAQLRDRGR